MMNRQCPLFSLWIVNKSGGLVYDKNFHESKALEVNQLLHISGMFHGMHAISKQLSQTGKECSGIEMIEAEGFRFHCFESPTGIKFLCSTDPSFSKATEFLAEMYVLYSDYVLKNPFYNVDQFGIGQPIRVERFDAKLEQLMQDFV